MPERPLLILPQPTTTVRHKLNPAPPRTHRPSPGRQRDRLNPKFEALQRAFEARRLELRYDPAGAEPESVLVLETVGRVDDFYKAVRKSPGLEWLLDVDQDDIEADEEFYEEGNEEATLPGRLYLVMFNQEGLQQLLSLWDIFRKDPDKAKFDFGQAKWRDLFRNLREIRPWGPADRLRDTGLLEDWDMRVLAGEERVRVEVELWARGSEQLRSRATRSVTTLIEEAGGGVLGEMYLPEIAYHAVLADLPIATVQTLFQSPDTELLKCEQIMFFRPTGQAVAPTPEGEPLAGPGLAAPLMPEGKEPVVGLLDGMPLGNHERLAGWLLLDDPDDWAQDYPPSDRHHGTAMASLIVNGDINAAEGPLSMPVYVRPILKPSVTDFTRPKFEGMPEEILAVDLIHRAVRRIFEGEGKEPPAAPSIRVINLSIGDKSRPFDRYPSPLARLIDFLSWKYGVLFVVSAGNQTGSIELDFPKDQFALLRADAARLEGEVLMALNRDTRNRRLLSPSESVNCLTVGAMHSDASNANPIGERIDPYRSVDMPSPINSHGPGFKRAIKPEVLMPGGKQTFREKLVGDGENATLEISKSSAKPGQSVATPGAVPGTLNAVRHTCGTSNATALTSRLAARIYDSIRDLRNEPGGEVIEEQHVPALIKSMLGHGASWRSSLSGLEVLREASRNTLARLLGYGGIRPTMVFGCESHRATLIGCGVLKEEEGHLYTVPLPPSLSGRRVWRRVTATLSWITPVNCKHNRYAKAHLWFAPYGDRSPDSEMAELLGVGRSEADWRAARRGTVQHEIFEGETAKVFADRAELQIQVNCRSLDGSDLPAIPYALIVSVETAEGLGLEIYDEIRSRIRPPVPIRPEG